MRDKTIGAIVAATYGGLLAVWLVALQPARRAFARQPALREPGGVEGRSKNDARLGTTAGVLLVFLANILTLGLFVGGLFSPGLAARLSGLRLRLPRAVNLLGACLFILGGVWGTLVLIYNPDYTPFFMPPSASGRLATRGPHAIVRHPQYAIEAAMNAIIAAFTGAWLPLLGILGWPAMRRQARIEEEDLLRTAPGAYGAYYRRAGRFVPRWMAKNSD